MNHHCSYCQAPLATRRPHARYCSHACRTAAWRKRKNRHKLSPGEATRVTPAAAPSPPGRHTVLPPSPPTHAAPHDPWPAVPSWERQQQEQEQSPHCQNCRQPIPSGRRGQLYCCSQCSAFHQGSKSPLVRFGIHTEGCPLFGQPWRRELREEK